MKEKEIERILVTEIKKMGGRAYKWVSPGNNGVPDRIAILPGMRPIFVELKTETGKLSPLQKIQIDWLRSMEQRVYVLYGKQAVLEFLDVVRRRMPDGI